MILELSLFGALLMFSRQLSGVAGLLLRRFGVWDPTPRSVYMHKAQDLRAELL